MLDLKAKLAAAGLVSQSDIDRADAARKRKQDKRAGRQGPPKGPSQPQLPELPVASLRAKTKGELYETVRRWVERVRLDVSSGPPSDAARPFHFSTAAGKVGRLVLEPDMTAALESGSAGLIAYMSNHGLAHAVVPASAAAQLAEVMPLWLRVLVGDDRAGQVEPKVAPTSP